VGCDEPEKIFHRVRNRAHKPEAPVANGNGFPGRVLGISRLYTGQRKPRNGEGAASKGRLGWRGSSIDLGERAEGGRGVSITTRILRESRESRESRSDQRADEGWAEIYIFQEEVPRDTVRGSFEWIDASRRGGTGTDRSVAIVKGFGLMAKTKAPKGQQMD
jgi:hypothetical protein